MSSLYDRPGVVSKTIGRVSSFQVSRASDEMTRGKREQRSSGIRGPRKQGLEHGRQEVVVEREKAMGVTVAIIFHSSGIPRSISFLPSITFMHAMRRHRPLLFSENIEYSLSNCDHATSQFHCCPGTRIVPSLRELDRQNQRALSVFSCLCVQACTLLIFFLQHPHLGIVRVFPKPKETSEEAISPNHFVPTLLSMLKGRLLASMLIPL